MIKPLFGAKIDFKKRQILEIFNSHFTGEQINLVHKF